MVQVTFIEHNGDRRSVEAEEGSSLMEAAVGNGVLGIDADCGGQCSCATCHVILDDDWFKRLPLGSDMEDSMLEINMERTDHSRLSCQIEVTKAMAGMTVTLPEFQG